MSCCNKTTDPVRFGGATLDVVSDSVTGRDLEALFSETTGWPVTHARFTDEVLVANPFLAKLSELVDAARLTGNADFETLREINPGLQSFRSWLAGSGRKAFAEALGPDLRFDAELLVCEPPAMAARLRFACTPRGSFLERPVNGRAVSFAENVFYAFEAGRIKEAWSVIDKAAIEAQRR